MFPAQIYQDRRGRLRGLMGNGLILLLGNEESPMNYPGNVYPFRQDSTFLYFFGLDTPGLAAILDLDSGREIVFGDDLTLDDIVWMGEQPTLAEKCRLAGVESNRPLTELEDALKKARAGSRPIHTLPAYRADNKLKLQSLLTIPPAEAKEAASVELIQAVVRLRSIKAAEEIAEIERAADMTGNMHLAAMRAAQVGRTEAEVAAAVQRVVQAEDGYPSFPIILTVRGEILHNPRHENILQNGQLVLCDAGAQTRRCYAADMTRTFPVAATFSSRQRDIYGVVLRAQEAAIDALRPGVLFRDVHLLAARTIAEGLKDLGLMKGDVAAAVTQGAHALFFPHGLGHMMGLDVHDMEDLGEDYVGYEDFARSRQFGLKSLRLARTLKPGFVLTIEPGVYFIPALIDRWRSEGKFGDFIAYDAVEAFKDFSGVRIEEDYLITEGGSHLLGKPAPKSIEEIEAIRGGAVSA